VNLQLDHFSEMNNNNTFLFPQENTTNISKTQLLLSFFSRRGILPCLPPLVFHTARAVFWRGRVGQNLKRVAMDDLASHICEERSKVR